MSAPAKMTWADMAEIPDPPDFPEQKAGKTDTPRFEPKVADSRSRWQQSLRNRDTNRPSLARQTQPWGEPPPLPVYVSSLDSYEVELAGCQKSRNGVKRIKRAARLATVQGLRVLANGGAPPPAAKECKLHVHIKRKDALGAYMTSEVSRVLRPKLSARVIVARLARALSVALGEWASGAFVLVKGGAAMRFHFDRVRARARRDTFAAFEKGNLAAVIALEPSDFDAELNLAPETPPDVRRAAERAADRALSSARRKLQQGSGQGRYRLRQQVIPSDSGHPLTLFRLLVDIEGICAEFLDFAIPSTDDPKAVFARNTMRAGDLLEHPAV
jgi:hypothetical protein